MSALARKAQPIVGLMVVVAASIAVAWGIRHHVMTSPRFAVRTVRVEGTARRNSEQVAASAGLQVGKNIFGIDLENARVRILQDAWIEKATVKRKLPSTIMVEVTEREAAAAVAVGPELYLCTHEGELFKRLEPGDPSKLVVITGLTTEQVAHDRAGAIRRIRSALDLLLDYEQRGPSKRLPAQEVHLGQDGTAQIMVGREGVTLELGQSPYRQKIMRAARVLDEIERRHAQPSVVFLDNDAHPERVVVRMR
jgi:cell division protein FtsQ